MGPIAATTSLRIRTQAKLIHSISHGSESFAGLEMAASRSESSRERGPVLAAARNSLAGEMLRKQLAWIVPSGHSSWGPTSPTAGFSPRASPRCEGCRAYDGIAVNEQKGVKVPQTFGDRHPRVISGGESAVFREAKKGRPILPAAKRAIRAGARRRIHHLTPNRQQSRANRDTGRSPARARPGSRASFRRCES